MKHLNTYKLFESDSVTTRVSGRRDQAKEAIPEFISKMSGVINTNYEIYDIDEDSIMNTLNSYLTADKGKIKIEYRDICGDISEVDNTGRVIAMILNFGYSIGYFSGKPSLHNVDIQFDEFIRDVFKALHFEKVSDNKLTYDGPNVLSSSITASSFNTHEQIKRIKDSIKRYYHGNKEIGELSVLVGCVYQYGYGLGNDTAYVVQMEEHEKILKFLKNRGEIN